MNTLLQDLRYALRQLRHSPGFTLTAVLTLALGVGASSAIFCLIDGLWLHPVRVPHPGELVRLFSTTQQDSEGGFTYPEFRTIAERTTALKSVVALGRRGSMMARSDGTSTLLLTNVVSSNFFEALGVKPILGRSFGAGDAERLRTHPACCWATASGVASLPATRASSASRLSSCAGKISAARWTCGAYCRRSFARSTMARTATCGCLPKPGPL